MWFVGLPLINELDLCIEIILKLDICNFYFPTNNILTPLRSLQYVYIDPIFIIYNSCDNTSKLLFLRYYYRRLWEHWVTEICSHIWWKDGCGYQWNHPLLWRHSTICYGLVLTKFNGYLLEKCIKVLKFATVHHKSG